MGPMTSNRACPQCSAPLPGSAAPWLCPKCLLGQAVTPEAPEDPFDAPAAPAPPNPPAVLHYFGDYELLSEIARGGMGVVYKARQLSLNRVVAVKLLQFGRLAGDQFKSRFRAEAEAAASLQHPNIVAIHEVGEHEGQQYFSMDYVDGADLAEMVREKPLPPRRAAGHVETIARAIHYAHQRGVLHRDLKPSNILMDPGGQPRITDFGLAKRLEFDSHITVTGQILGTPHYMPPEQAEGKRGEISTASDVYSLGAILYHLLTGRPPFIADSFEAVLAQLLHREPVRPRLLNPGIPRDLETICLKCLSKEPHRRYATAQALAEDLGHWRKGEPICARPVGAAERLVRWCRRKPALATLAVTLHVVAGAGLAGVLWQWRRAEQHAISERSQRLRAEQAVTSLELQRAEDLLDQNETTMGMAYLARIVRQQPANDVAARRLLSALTQRDFALPVGLPLPHGRKIAWVEFSPDGRRVVTAALDFCARIWDARTGHPLTPPLVHQSDVRFARFSPDGSRVLTVADDHRASLWDAAGGEVLGHPMSHAGTIHAADFSPDGRLVLTASDDGTAQLWDGHTGLPVSRGTLRHAGAVLWAAFSPDGSQVVTGSADHTAQLWDVACLQPSGKPLRHAAPVQQAQFSPGGQWVVTRTQNATCVWEANSGAPLAAPLIRPEVVHHLQFHHNGQQIVTASDRGLIQLWNARDWAPLGRPLRHAGILGMILSPGGDRILTFSSDHTARLWEVQSGARLAEPMQHAGGVWSAAFSPDGRFAATASADKTARIWDLRPGAMRCLPMSHTADVRAAEFSPDGQRIVTATFDGTARLWDSHSGEPRGSVLAHAGWVHQATFSPDGGRVATASFDGTARIWDARTGYPMTEPLRHASKVSRLDFSPDGRWLATASHDRTVRLWDAHTGEPWGDAIQHAHIVNLVCFSPDGAWILSSDGKDDLAQIRDVLTRRVLVELRGHEGWIASAEFSPDGRRVVTASEDGTARLWDAQTGQALFAPLQHKGFVCSAHFNSEGQWVVTGSLDATAQVWNAHTGQPVGEPLRHRAEVLNARFSPDSRLVVTASADGTARVWDAQSGRPIAEPFRQDGKVWDARFSPEGRRVVTASEDTHARVWDVPPTFSDREDRIVTRPAGTFSSTEGEGRLPAAQTGGEGEAASPSVLLASLAEALVGSRVNDQGAFESVPPKGLGEIRQQLAKLPRDADFARWLEWFFADRSGRTISP